MLESNLPSEYKAEMLTCIPLVFVWPGLKLRRGMTAWIPMPIVIVSKPEPWVIAHEWVHTMGGDEAMAEFIECFFSRSTPGK